MCVRAWLFIANARKEGWEGKQAGLNICKAFGVLCSSSTKTSNMQMNPQNLTKGEVELLQICQCYLQDQFVF